MYSSTPYGWCISFSFFFLLVIMQHFLHLELFPSPFSIQSPLIEISQNQTQKLGESHSQQQFNFIFLAFFSLKARGWL